LTWGSTNYYFNVRAKNNLEVVGNYSSSNGIYLVDPSAPTGKPSTPACNQYSNTTTVAFNWTVGAAIDAESHIMGYLMQIGTAEGGNDIFEGYVGNVLTYSANIGTNGITYYARVKARNRMGLYADDAYWSVSSNGIRVDLTAPAKPTISSSPSEKRSDGSYLITLAGSTETGAHIGSDSIEVYDQDAHLIKQYISSALATGTTTYSNDLSVAPNGDISGTITLEDIPGIYPLVTSVEVKLYVYDAAGNRSAEGTAFTVAFDVDESAFDCWNNKYVLGTSVKNPTIVYRLQESSKVTIKIFTLLGDLVKTIVDKEDREPGYYSEEWDLSSDGSSDIVGSGIYLVHINAPGSGSDPVSLSETKKIAVIK
jgi:hypothetical protein